MGDLLDKNHNIVYFGLFCSTHKVVEVVFVIIRKGKKYKILTKRHKYWILTQVVLSGGAKSAS